MSPAPESSSHDLFGEAKAVSRHLTALHPGIDAILVFGSVARGDANSWSDIDLLVLGADPSLTARLLRRAVLEPSAAKVSLIYYSTAEFRAMMRSGSLFASHIAGEAVPLFDRIGIGGELGSHAAPTSPEEISTQLRELTAKLDSYADSRPFGNNFLFCLSHLYKIGKGVVMLGLAKDGVLEFNREAAFERFAALHPELKPQLGKVAELRPFYQMVTGRAPEDLPFSYRTAGKSMEDAVLAIRTVAERMAPK